MEMVDLRAKDIWSKHPSFLDCYALVWNPLSQYEPLTLLPILSKEFDFVSNQIHKRNWNVYNIIYGLYHEQIVLATDVWINAVMNNEKLEHKIDAAQCTINRLELAISDIKNTKDGNNSQILEMAIELKELAERWIRLKKENVKYGNMQEKQSNKKKKKMVDTSKIASYKQVNENENGTITDRENIIDRMIAKAENKSQLNRNPSLGLNKMLKSQETKQIFEKLKIIQNVSQKVKAKFLYILDKNLINYNIFSFQNLLVKNHKNYNNLLIDRIYQEIQKWNVLEHLRKYYIFKTDRIYKENLNIHISEYIISNIYKYKTKRRSMSYDLRKEPFKNLINAKKSDENRFDKENEINNYRKKLKHLAYYGTNEELTSMIEDELFQELDDEERKRYKTMLENRSIKQIK